MSLSNSESNKFNSLNELFVIYDFIFEPIKAYLNHTQELILNLETELAAKVVKWDIENYNSTDIPDGFSFH